MKDQQIRKMCAIYEILAKKGLLSMMMKCDLEVELARSCNKPVVEIRELSKKYSDTIDFDESFIGIDIYFKDSSIDTLFLSY